jgi:hypothetical protein
MTEQGPRNLDSAVCQPQLFVEVLLDGVTDLSSPHVFAEGADILTETNPTVLAELDVLMARGSSVAKTRWIHRL